MPKMKTKSSVKKRFKVTGNGNVKSGQAKTSHMMMNKPKSMKRKAKRTTTLSDADATIVLENWLPYARKNKSKSPYNPELDPANDAYKAPAKAPAKAKKTTKKSADKESK